MKCDEVYAKRCEVERERKKKKMKEMGEGGEMGGRGEGEIQRPRGRERYT